MPQSIQASRLLAKEPGQGGQHKVGDRYNKMIQLHKRLQRILFLRLSLCLNLNRNLYLNLNL